MLTKVAKSFNITFSPYLPDPHPAPLVLNQKSASGCAPTLAGFKGSLKRLCKRRESEVFMILTSGKQNFRSSPKAQEILKRANTKRSVQKPPSSGARARSKVEFFKSSGRTAYTAPEVHCLGHATEMVLGRAECESAVAAKRIRRLIDESGGSLSNSPAKECKKLQINLSLVSKQFRKLYNVSMRAYARRIRMMTAERLLKTSSHLNVDETARLLGYSFTSAFSRCFQKTFGKRPKRYQMQSGSISRELRAKRD